jgi:hypothetical protein
VKSCSKTENYIAKWQNILKIFLELVNFFPKQKQILQQINSLSLAFVWNFTHAK